MSATDCTATEVVEAISIPDLTALIAGYVDEPAQNCGVCNAEAFRAAGPTCNCHAIYHKCEECGHHFLRSKWCYFVLTTQDHVDLANGREIVVNETEAYLLHPPEPGYECESGDWDPELKEDKWPAFP